MTDKELADEVEHEVDDMVDDGLVRKEGRQDGQEGCYLTPRGAAMLEENWDFDPSKRYSVHPFSRMPSQSSSGKRFPWDTASGSNPSRRHP